MPIVHLPVPDKMTNEQLFAVAARTQWDGLVVLGFNEDGEFICLNAGVKVEWGVVLAKLFERHVMRAFDEADT